ncbi:hypothetical protein Cal6303_1331 [Calothrix sp. PCC 6303]|nr:hypothetical protein Cal6303_1331 [Calothrix sp. PCC 6303]
MVDFSLDLMSDAEDSITEVELNIMSAAKTYLLIR